MMFQGRFEGKAMVVTGAAQGIGKMVALRAAAEGARVLLVDRAPFVTETAVAADGEAYGLVADLESYTGAEAAMDKARMLFGGIDVLINNVGGAIRMRPYHTFEPGQIEAEIRRSLMPTLWCCHAALPVMLAQRRGTIVNVSSTATCGIRRVPYSAAKGGVNAITASLAMEYGPLGIRVVAAAPGGTQAPPRRVPRNPDGDNDQEQGWMAEAVTQVTASTYMKRYGTLEEQAGPILFLASDEAAYITGSVLPVSGGDQG
ncbi:benzoate diol dehydrogenase BenD [Acidocella aminolytica]|uniref:Oxidoreductase/short-chain dehydrogenase/reductase SDR n=1 Tax=Acidocella aminolytica 101 = DSM 11237 TaxID=1120923 RepID=A0A0D6PDX9_9PROT|nr:benzoate diol dehydrogenase BenD [Acidocella aminolytica]GAN79867.1 oxidoreductase/short-chain dehydrogenase/reductase SDR [Acidocella aminolytica 101 = DSM 11237]GBQ38845.1 dehydrogenase [Acidocella aminolytica 101 = DSM 11237]SHE60964.1 dihydroxycyclohexadiene carboxylate dehydrogenase [Acidocella aminolytica 101 = DSM 11237]